MISIRPLQKDDYKSLFDVMDSQRAYLGVWLPFIKYSQKPEDTQAFVESDIANENTYTCAIIDDNRAKGLVGLKDIDRTNRKAEIGYWLSEDLQGKGIMTEAVRQLLHEGFVSLDLNRIQIKAAVGNTKSRTIPERLGFVLEGIERDGELLDDGYADLAIYSLLRKEFVK